MESLRAQLAETQGALTERDVKFRQLKVEYRDAATAWSHEKDSLEARLAVLESENLRLRSALPSKPNVPKTPKTPGTPATPAYHYNAHSFALTWMGRSTDSWGNESADVDDSITMTRSRMEEAETQFKQLTDEVAERDEMCKVLETKLSRLSMNIKAASGMDEDQAVLRWNQLRDQVHNMSIEYLNNTFSAHLVSAKYQDEFKALSPHWKTYSSTPNMASYLFRALIWRYLLRYFLILCRASGRDVSRKVGEAAAIVSTILSSRDYQDWCIHTATLVHKTYPIDQSLVGELVGKIGEAITPLIAQGAVDAVQKSLLSIVTATAELSAEFDKSRFVVLMYNEPGSTLTHGFPYADKLMDVKATLGGQGVVDLMITPSLLKKELEFSVLVKADVAC